MFAVGGVEQGQQRLIVSNIDFKVRYASRRWRGSRLEILGESWAFLVVPVTKEDVRSRAVQFSDGCRADALSATCGLIKQ